MTHRHTYEVTRWQRHGTIAHGSPLIKRCAVCGKTVRDSYGRWVVTDPGTSGETRPFGIRKRGR